MVRYGLWFLLFVLLASCTQTPVPEGPNVAPTVPTALSTDFNDIAQKVVADVQGNAYISGYRNYAADYATGKVERPAEFFVSQLSPNGTLKWLTNPPVNGPEDDFTASYMELDLDVTNAAVYMLTQANTSLAQLHRLEFDGTLSWSKAISRGELSASQLFAAPNGTLYVKYYSDNLLPTVKAFSGEGDELWSRELPNTRYTLLGVGGDNGLYFSEPGYLDAEGVRNLYLHKYDAAGSPLWTRDIAPGIPFRPWQYDYPDPAFTLAVRGNAVYTVVNFSQQSPESSNGFGVVNTEIRRFADDGTEVWSTLLHPASTGSPTFGYHVLPVGVTDAADLYMLVEEWEVEGPNPNPLGSDIGYYKQRLIRFSGEGQRMTSAVQTYSDGLTVATLVPAQVKDARDRPHTVFYTVNTIGNFYCNNDFDPSKPCAYTDIQVSLYKNNAALQWSLR